MWGLNTCSGQGLKTESPGLSVAIPALQCISRGWGGWGRVKYSQKTGFNPFATRDREHISFSQDLSGVCGMGSFLSKDEDEEVRRQEMLRNVLAFLVLV